MKLSDHEKAMVVWMRVFRDIIPDSEEEVMALASLVDAAFNNDADIMGKLPTYCQGTIIAGILSVAIEHIAYLPFASKEDEHGPGACVEDDMAGVIAETLSIKNAPAITRDEATRFCSVLLKFAGSGTVCSYWTDSMDDLEHMLRFGSFGPGEE